MTLFHVFFVCLFLSVFFQSINSDSVDSMISIVPRLNVNSDINTTVEATSDQTTLVPSRTTTTITTVNITHETTVTTTSTSTVSPTIASTTIIKESTTSGVDNNRPVPLLSRRGWWLLAAVIVAVIVIIGIGLIYYQRQHTPYRRFLQNWRLRDDDADNIILQLEQPEVMNDQWPPRISFA